jgi:hypothetical protein
LLIDPAPEEVYDNMSKEYLEDFVYRYNTKFENRPIGERREWNYFLKTREYMRNISISDSIRIILLSATQFNWFDFHSKMIQNNTHAKHLRIEGHHELRKDKPELVIKLIRELISLNN